MNKAIINIWNEIGLEYLYVEEGSSFQAFVKEDSTKKIQPNTASYKKNLLEKKETKTTTSTSKIADVYTNKEAKNIKDTPLYTLENTWDTRFQTLYRSMKPTPLLWTYYELGNDIFSTPSKERRSTIKDILTTLNMPQGTHSFLPFTAPNSKGELVVHIDEFRSIIAKLSPALLLCFGTKGLDAFLEKKIIHYWGEIIFQAPLRAIILPSIETLDIMSKRQLLLYIKEYIKNTGLGR